MARILCLEDDPMLGQGIKLLLELEDYEVFWARDLRSARMEAERNPPDLYLLDWNLPDGTGIELAREIRSREEDVPLIFLTARSDEDSAVMAFANGADDFVRKPFGEQELLVRIKRGLKESHRIKDEIRCKDLILERSARKAFFRKQEIPLSPTEFTLLELLVKNFEGVVTRDRILENTDDAGESDARSLDSHVSHLRTRLKKAGVDSLKIVAVYGEGYRLERKGE